MKKILFAIVACFVLCVFAFGATGSSAKRKEIASTVYGKIQLVNIGEDYKVRVVNAGEDLRVCVYNASGTCRKPGQWQFVSTGGKKVRFVNIGEDFSIRFVDAGEGVSRY